MKKVYNTELNFFFHALRFSHYNQRNFQTMKAFTGKSKHSIAIWLTLVIKENNKANITDYPLIHRLCTGSVFGGKNCKLIAFSPESSGWAGQLSTIITTFLCCILNLRSSSCNHSSKSVPSIHALFWDRHLQRRLRTCLKHLGLADFPITSIRIFSPRALDAAISVNRTLLCFPPLHFLTSEVQRFWWRVFGEQTKFIYIKNIL